MTPTGNTFGTLTTPTNTSDFKALVDRAVRYHNALTNQTATVAAEMYADLIGRNGPGWGRFQARSVTRELHKAAGFDNLAAAHWQLAWRKYNTVLAARRTSARPKFDVNK